MNSAYSMYGGHLTIKILYIMTQWSILSQTATNKSERVSSTSIHLTENYHLYEFPQSQLYVHGNLFTHENESTSPIYLTSAVNTIQSQSS